MQKKIILPLLLMIFMLIPLAAGAQSMPHGKWWKDPKVVEDLGLTEDQVSRLDTAFKDSRRKLIKLKSDVESERFELDTLVDSNKLDEAKVDAQFKKLSTAQQSLGAERFRFIMEIRKIVGPEKFSQIKAMYMKSHRGRFMKDRGDPER